MVPTFPEHAAGLALAGKPEELLLGWWGGHAWQPASMHPTLGTNVRLHGPRCISAP